MLAGISTQSIVPAQKDVSHTRLDTGKDIFNQLTSVFDDLQMGPRVKPDTAMDGLTVADSDVAIVNNAALAAEPSDEMRIILANKNIQNLQKMNHADVLLNVCLDLVYLKPYTQIYMRPCKGDEFTLPTTLSEATAVRARLLLIFKTA